MLIERDCGVWLEEYVWDIGCAVRTFLKGKDIARAVR